ncbi:hypothetical protein Hte_000439 [Hypoxylon texense]
MLNGWTTQVITLACLVVRVVAAAQAALCVSLLASLVVEKCPMPRPSIAYLSVMRSIGGDPLNLLKSSLTVMARRREAYVELFLLIALTALSLVLQFSSTILLSDLGVTRLLQYQESIRHNVALWSTPEKEITAANMIYSQNGINPTFGELETKDTLFAVPNSLGVSNTGNRRRAFLPFEQDNRTSLRSYNGPAVVTTSRVNCLRPSISADIVLSDEYMGSKNYTHALVVGNISYGDTFKSLNSESGVPQLCVHNKHLTSFACLPVNFSCSIHTFSGADIRISADKWTTSLCSLTDPDLTTTASNDEHNNGQSIRWNMDEQQWDPTAEWTFMTLATNLGHKDLVEMKGDGISQLQLREPSAYQEWISYELARGLLLNMTICSVGFNATLANVELSSSVDPREPTAKSSLGTNVSVFEDVQNFLGAGASYHNQSERGVLSINKIQDITSVESLFPGQHSSIGSAGSPDLGYIFHINSIAQWVGVSFTIGTWSGQGYSILSCVDCTGVGPVVAEDSASVFQNIINTSERAAIAIDTFLIHFAFNWYYQLLSAFDGVSDIEVSFSADFIVPVNRQGFCAITVIIATHLVCVWIIASLYIKQVKFTRQGKRATVQAVQQHMTGKGHCKFDITEEDSEFAEFYNFSGPEDDAESDIEAGGEERNQEERPMGPSRRLPRTNQDSIRLPSGKIISKQSSTQAGPSLVQSRRRHWTSPLQLEHRLEPNDEERSTREELDSDVRDTRLLSKREKRERASITYQLTHLSTNDRSSLMHLPTSQQLSILAAQHRQAEKMQQKESRRQGRIDRKGNKNLYAYWATETPVYQCG